MRTFRTFLLISTLLLMSGVASPATAQGLFGGAAENVQWTTDVVPATVAPGDTAHVRFRASISGDWKMYALDSPPPSRGVGVAFDSLAAGLQHSPIRQRTPQRGYDPNFEKDVTYFAGEAVLEADIAVDASVAPGTYDVAGTITYMICNDQMCLPPTDQPFTQPLQVATGATSSAAPLIDAPSEPTPKRDDSVASATGDLDDARRGGLWGFLLLAVGAGAAALLTPCVFPMIPLTVSYFTKHADDRGEAVRMASVYGLSIIVIFTGLGALMAALIGASGAQSIAANPWVNLFIGGVFIVFALSLLGLFELRLPSGLLNYVNQQGNERAGYVGVLFMGLTLSLVSFSCTAPFVGGLLAATTGGEWTYPVVGMMAFSATFALPFVGFALFPNRLEALPKSGSWMNVVKVVLGFVELAAALKFLSNADLIWGWNVLSRPLAIAITVTLFALCGMYLLGKLRLAHEPPTEQIGSLRLLSAAAFLGLALYMLPGLFGAQLGAIDAYLPPRQASDPNLMATAANPNDPSANEELDWFVDDRAAAFEEARAQDKPVFVDFTGYTCTNCRDMEANVFTEPAVARRFEQNFVLLRLYTDAPPKGPEYQRYQLRLTGTTALPTYVVLDPQSETPVERVSGTMSAEAFGAFLDRGAAAFSNQQLAAR
jgi:thiol:disulfide interchange protein DsbD